MDIDIGQYGETNDTNNPGGPDEGGMVVSDEGITGVPGAEDRTVFPDKNITGVSNAEAEESSIKHNLDGKYGPRLTRYSLRD